MSDQGATAQAKDKAQEVAGQAQEKAQEAAGQARDQVRSQIDSRSTQAGERIGGHARSLRSVGEALRERGEDQPAKLADQAAERLDRAGKWLSQSDSDRILDDVEGFARKNPWAVMAGGIALGFAASRVLKASSTDRYHRRGSAPQLPRTTTPVAEDRFSRPPATAPSTVPPMPSVPPVTGTGGI